MTEELEFGEWLREYKAVVSNGLREFGIERTQEEVEALVQQAIIDAIFEEFKDHARKALRGKRSDGE